LNVYGGNLTLDCAGLALTTVTITGGTVRLLNSGTITTLNAYGGTFDASGCQRPVTITTLNTDFAATFLRGTNLTISTSNVANLGARGLNRV
jgi:glutamine amidotransferase PdxT